MRLTGAGQVIYRGLEEDDFWLQSMKQILDSSPAGADAPWVPLQGVRIRSTDFLPGCRVLFGSGSFGDVGVQGEAARQPQSHVSWCEGALAAPLCFPEPEFQGLR